MEKLIKLLDAYDHKRTEDLEWGKQWVENQKLWIISKQFGFIWWLVKHNKIDFDALKPLSGVTEIMLATNYPNGIKAKRRYRLYEQLIMLLSISDDPVKDLINYLK